MDTGLSKESLKRFLIFAPIAAGVSLIHVDNFIDGMLTRYVDQTLEVSTATGAVQFRQARKPEFSVDTLQAVLIASPDRMHGFDVEYAAKQAISIDKEALNRLFTLPEPPKPPPKVPAIKIKPPNLAEKVKSILRIDMLSARGAVINSRLYYVGEELQDRIPPRRGRRRPIPLFLEGISMKTKSAIIRIGKTGKIAAVPMVY